MIFYLSLFLLVCFVSFIYNYAKDVNIIFLSKYAVFLLLFVPLAFRKGIGTDYYNYVKIFNNLSAGIPMSQEIGWYLLNQFVIKCGLSVQWIFIISGFITIYCIMQTPRKDSFIIIVLFYSLFYLESYNIVRQCLSMSICWLAFLYFNKGEKRKGYFISILAVLFHYASIIVILCFFIMDKIKITERAFKILLIIIFSFVESGLLLKLLFLGLSYTKYGVYIKRFDLFSNLSTAGVGGLSTFAVRSFILLAMYYSIPEELHEKKKNYTRVMLLALFTFDLLGISFYLFQRVRIYFFLTYMIIFTYIFHTTTEMKKLRNAVYLIFFILYYLVLKLLTGSGAIIPYTHV